MFTKIIKKGGLILRKRMTIRLMLMRNSLTQTWLINRLEETGVNTDKTELSSVLAGRRKGAKAETVIQESLKILQDYEEKMGVVW
jgi:hypothetical protein